ncbi:Protein toll [Papilio xuthus]|uniref:Protein toll n=1 Tax=Papilio xuthus TaxID=66420 RepID=A0A194PXY5_PAPXU|nr:Protein toll [Papilio xuthus]
MNELKVRRGMTHMFSLVLVICTMVISASTDFKALKCPPSPAQCQYDVSVFDEHFYFVEDLKFVIVYRGTYLSFKCPEGVGFESESMPRFSSAVRVQLLVLTHCAVPAASFASALAALNVTVLDKLILREPRGDLRSFHMTGLGVSALEVRAKERVALEEEALGQLGALAELWLVGVALPEAALLRLPASLLYLHIESCNMTEFATPALRRLSSLVHLRLYERTLTVAPDLSAVPSLRSVSFIAPLNGLPSSNTVKNLTSQNCNSLEILGECGALSRLEVSGAGGAPGAGWLARCPALAELVLSDTRVDALPADLVRAAPRLRRLAVRGCRLRHLPPDLLAHTRDLQELDFSNNRLETLPEQLLVSVRALRSLELSNNRLTLAGARAALAPTSLHRLVLDGNPLGDLCQAGSDALYPDGLIERVSGVSALFEMRALRTLSLARTALTRLCADWRRDMRALARLDLRHNNISALQVHARPRAQTPTHPAPTRPHAPPRPPTLTLT